MALKMRLRLYARGCRRGRPERLRHVIALRPCGSAGQELPAIRPMEEPPKKGKLLGAVPRLAAWCIMIRNQDPKWRFRFNRAMTRKRRSLLLFGVLAIASFLRFYHLTAFPVQPSHDPQTPLASFVRCFSDRVLLALLPSDGDPAGPL